MKLPSSVIKARKFDDADHGLSHCMKAVDFIIELRDRYLFIEIKDPQHPQALPTNQNEWIRKFQSGSIDVDLGQKYRDTFLYEWATGKSQKPIYYYVLIALDTLTDADLVNRTDALKRSIPAEIPPSVPWTKKVVHGCAVFNIHSWNKTWKQFHISRT